MTVEPLFKFNSALGNPAEWIAGQETEAFPWDEARRYPVLRQLIRPSIPPTRSRDGNRNHPTTPRPPWQNGHVERLIGSIRRECFDHLVVFGEADLSRVLKSDASYYNSVRTHLALNKNSPLFRRRQTAGNIVSIPILGGLHHQCVRV